MYFYEVASSVFTDSDNGVVYHATRKSAMAEAREAATYMRDRDGSHDVTVERVELANTKRESIIALANHRGWCASRKKVWPK